MIINFNSLQHEKHDSESTKLTRNNLETLSKARLKLFGLKSAHMQRYVEQLASESISVSEAKIAKIRADINNFFELTKPYFVENWSKELRALLPKHLIIQESSQWMATLIGYLVEERNSIRCHEMVTSAVKKTIEKVEDSIAYPIFFRLGSRSPKRYGGKNQIEPILGSQEIENELLNPTERCLHDLLDGYCSDYTHSLVFVQYRTNLLKLEYRAFVSDRRLVGITPTTWKSGQFDSSHQNWLNSIEKHLKLFLWECVERSGLETLVVDMGIEVSNEGDPKVVLIEINPFLSLTHPGFLRSLEISRELPECIYFPV